ncbi:MAG: tRNA epoxyqueuosine(34) reductase QueG [Gemmataceae bacterium]
MAVLEDSLKDFAQTLGFALVGVAPATAADGFDRLTEWLDRDYAGEMEYMRRRAEARQHPASILPDVRTVIMVGREYGGGRETPNVPGMAKIARYAAGPDYHEVIWRQLDKLLAWLQAEVPGCQGRGVVDTAPLLERDFARRAGLGWIGKNTMLINKHRGSYFFLGALLVDIELKPDPPHEASHCGTCTACLDACPTDAFPGPGWLDARRCISYLTIELRGPIPAELRPGVGDWLFGCDVCQEVCPWNRYAAGSAELVDPVEIVGLSEGEFRRRYGGTALTRTKCRGLVRNAAIVLGNVGDERALSALTAALQDPEPTVRESAEWAIEQIRGRR